MRRIFAGLQAAFHRSDSAAYQTMNWIIWFRVLVSVGFFVADLTLDLGDEGWIHVADRVVLGIFGVELVLRVLTYHPPSVELFNLSFPGRIRYHVLGRLRFLLRPISVIDLVTVLALVPALRGLRALRILRLIRTWRFFRYSDPLAGVEKSLPVQRFRQVSAIALHCKAGNTFR